MEAFGRAVRGLLALVALVVLMVGVPVLLVRTVGNPWPGRDAVELRDEAALFTGALAAAAWVVWARFVIAIVVELGAQVTDLRRVQAARALSPSAFQELMPPTPVASHGFGLVAHRLIAAVLALLPLSPAAEPLVGALPARPTNAVVAAMIAAPSESVTQRSAVAPASVGDRPVVEVRANDTLFQLAERHLGDSSRWREILDLNVGEVQLDGGRLTTPSSLRRGWMLRLPVDAIGVDNAAEATTETRQVVEPGDSYWEIAEDHLATTLGRAPTPSEVLEITRALIDTNAPQLGHTDPTMLHPGDAIVIAAGDAAPTDGGSTYIVESGDSYWEIAEDRLTLDLGREPTASEVLEAAEALIDTNAPGLGYDDRAMIHPGDVLLVWPAPSMDAQPEADPLAGAAGDQPESEVLPATETTQAPAVEQPAAETPTAPASTPPEPTSASGTTTPAVAPPVVSAPPTVAPVDAPTDHVPPSSTVPPVAAMEDTPDAEFPLDEGEERGLGTPLRLGAAVLLAGGVLSAVDARRRAALRRSKAHARLAGPAGEAAATESQLRVLDPTAILLRLDLVLRGLAAAVRDQRVKPVVAVVDPNGGVRVLLDGHALLGSPWVPAGERWWSMPVAVTLEELVRLGSGVGLPCPALVHLGGHDGEQLFIDLEAVGVLAVDGTPDDVALIVDAIAFSLVVSPFTVGAELVLVGLDPSLADQRADASVVGDQASAIAVASSTIGTIASATAMGATTFELRAHSSVERWEPSLIVLGRDAGIPDPELVRLAGHGGQGVAVLSAVACDEARAMLRQSPAGWVLEPFGLRVDPVGIDSPGLAAVAELLAQTDAEPEVVEALPTQPSDAAVPDFEDRPWEVLVRILGGVRVHDGAGNEVRFERSKALELVTWMALHRESSTRSGARTALWEVDVRDATFANVVSDARRALARLAPPPDGDEWLARTLSEALPLHELVVTDAELLNDRVEASRSLEAAAAVEVLRPGLALVTDLPFAGTGYLWPDAEGTVTRLVLLVITAAVEMGRRCLDLGDIDGVFWATGQGLRVLPGHEELVALRMRAHAQTGDLAAVRAEWGSYERSLATDPWSDAEPTPKLVELRRRLLAGAPIEEPAGA